MLIVIYHASIFYSARMRSGSFCAAVDPFPRNHDVEGKKEVNITNTVIAKRVAARSQKYKNWISGLVIYEVLLLQTS